MVRWRLALMLAMLLLLPARISSKGEEDDDEERNNDDADDDDDDDEEEEEEDTEGGGKGGGGGGAPPPEKGGGGGGDPTPGAVRRRPAQLATPKSAGNQPSRPSKKRPLECYVCAYKSETPLRACLDPTKFRVHTITCHSVEDRCFTSVISKGESYEAVVRGCRSGCVGSPETTCCDLNRCNNQAFAMPMIQQRAMTEVQSKTNKLMPTNVLFFVTILLLLQTVVKVAIV